MNSEQLVDDQMIFMVRHLVATLGWEYVGQKWAESETALYVHMLAGTARIEQYLEHQHVTDEQIIRTLRKEIMSLLLECAEAVRQSQLKLWSDFMPDDEPLLEGGGS